MKPGMTRVLAALIAAAVAGGLVTAAGVVLAMVIQSYPYELPPFTGMVMTGGMMVAVMLFWLVVFTTGVFAVGLVIVGIPAWVALYRLGFRSRWTAALAGGLLASTTMTALALAMEGPGSDAVRGGLLMLLPGVAAGWTLHRLAYGKTEPGPA
jgi:hypothetical protein